MQEITDGIRLGILFISVIVSIVLSGVLFVEFQKHKKGKIRRGIILFLIYLLGLVITTVFLTRNMLLGYVNSFSLFLPLVLQIFVNLILI